MCGIAGLYGPFEREQLRRMTSAMAHRGPDGQGIDWRPGLRPGEHIGFGHCRLAIIDLVSGQQPMWTADGEIGIVFNGEIYNYRELRSELARQGASFRTTSDTEVILEGWRLRGEKFLSELSGMFAFGLWDGRTKEWVLARDRAGIKPFYYAQPSIGTLAFASEIKPLLPLVGGVTVQRRALYEFLLYSWTPGPETIFEGVMSLPPGTSARWSPGSQRLSPRTYLARAYAVPYRGSRAEAAAELRDMLDTAVTSHLVADVPVGINLSGGLDSSAVLASMVRQLPADAVDAFTVGFGLADDETPFAQRMAEHVGANFHTSLVPLLRIEEDFPRIVRILEEPVGHPVLQTTFEISRLARQHVKVTMIGEGADELFLGYPQYKLLTPPYCYAPPTVLQKTFMATASLMPPPHRLAEMLAGDFYDSALLHDVAHRFDGYFRQAGFAHGAQAFEFDYPLVANQLMRIDKLTMAHGLEARVPFLDNRLVQWTKGLPLGWKCSANNTKIILREAVAERLPDEILNRPKSGRGGTQALLPYLDALVTHGPFAGLVNRKTLAKRGWLNPEAVMRYLAERDSFLVRWNPIERRRRTKFNYALAVLEQWAREYLDRGAAS